MDRTRHKVEVSKEEFNKFVQEYPESYREPIHEGIKHYIIVSSKNLVWHKPIAVSESGKFYIIRNDDNVS